MLSFMLSDLLLIFGDPYKECFSKQSRFYCECRGICMCAREAYVFFFPTALDFFFLDFKYFAVFLTVVIHGAY